MRMFSVRKPGFTSRRRTKLRSSRPAPISRTNATATSAVTSARRRPRTPIPPATDRPPSLRPPCRSGCIRRSPGTRPNPRPTRRARTRERDHPKIETYLLHSRDRPASDTDAGPGHPTRPARRPTLPKDREHHALGENLAEEPRPRSPECRPHCDFTLTRGQAGEHQVGDIGAGDQQDQSHGSHEDEERRLHVAHHLFLKRNELDAPAGIAVGIALGEPLRDGRELRLRPGHRCPDAKATNHRRKSVPPRPGRIGGQRGPEVDGALPPEISRGHSDDGVRALGAEIDLASDGVGAATVMPLPVPVSDDDNSGRALTCPRRRGSRDPGGSHS